MQTAWDSLIPALERGDYDLAMNGLEIIPERLNRVLMSRPYYVYTLQLMVRKDDDRIRGIRDLRGKTVGTLARAVAHDLPTSIGGVDIRSYSAAWPYEDLALGRLDAAFLDTPITVYYEKLDRRLKYAGRRAHCIAGPGVGRRGAFHDQGSGAAGGNDGAHRRP